jgi:hypothetical protein
MWRLLSASTANTREQADMAVRAVSGRVNRNVTRALPASARASAHSTPAPTGGWNARDSLANMRSDDAVVLDNWFPRETAVHVRRGHASHATGLGDVVESLMSWNGPSSTKLFGAAGANIYDVTSSGAVGAAAVSSLTSARWQHTMFGISSGNYLYIVNGLDDPRHYNGSTWATPSLTGIGDAADLIHVNAFKGRLYFVEKNTLSFWYLPIESIAGTLVEFDLAPRCSRGGYLVAMGTWTRDGGTGMDDMAVFVTSEGEVVIYQGNDPGDAAAWSLVGTFTIGAPIGRRCLAQIGAELVIVTEDGFSPLSQFLAGARISEKAALSDKISGAVSSAVRSNRTRFGWQPVFYPVGNMILFNIPRATTNVQYVSNATTGAWCRFTGWDAECFAVHDDELYFGGDEVVYQADTGESDNGGEIDADGKSAFSYFGSRGRLKRFSMVRPTLLSDGAVDAALAINVDFADTQPESVPTFSANSAAEWDVALWDVALWGSGSTPVLDWLSVVGLGTAASIRIKTRSMNGEIQWNSTDWLWEPAGYI